MFKQASKTPAVTFAFEINVNVLYDEHRVKMPECSFQTQNTILVFRDAQLLGC